MSIYSGFATRQQETKYNSLLQNLVKALSKRLVKFYKKERTDQEKFKRLLYKIYKQMYFLEEGKFLNPKFTPCIYDLVDVFELEINDNDSVSDMSSIMGTSFSVDSGKSDKNPFLKSRDALRLKRNLIQNTSRNQMIKQNSIGKIRQMARLDLDDQKVISDMNTRKNTFDVFSYNVPKKSSRQKSVDLQPLNQTKTSLRVPHPPKIQKFIPNRQDIFRQKSFTGNSIRTDPVISKPQRSNFRKQKYQKINLPFH